MFPVTIGSSYQLVIEHDGNVYKSTLEKLLPSSPITDLSFQVKNDRSGVDLIISTQDLDSASRYYVWKLTETWKFHSPIFSSTRSVNKEICYATTTNELDLGTTELFLKNCFNRFPYLSIPVSSPKLYYRYSILVQQYSVSRSTYTYLSNVKKTNELGGSLFDPIPSNMTGNLTGDGATVIGNFQVSSLKTQRIYIDRSDLPMDLAISTGLEDCTIQSVNINNQISIGILQTTMIDMDTVSDFGGTTAIRFTQSNICFDCTASGSPNTPPSWWEEKK
jgi:hypothetical protein